MNPTLKNKIKRGLFFSLAVLVLFGIWNLTRPPSEAEQRLAAAESRLFEASPRLSDRSEPTTDRRNRDAEAVDLAAQQWFGELLERYPWMKVEFRDVPDEENGRLLYTRFIESLPDTPNSGNPLSIPLEIKRQIEDQDLFDPELVAQWLEKNQKLITQILAIAEAPDRSVKGVSHKDLAFISAAPAMDMVRLLHTEARLAMDSGDTERAQRNYRAAMNFASHFDRTETHTLLDKTVAILLGLQTQERFQSDVLPHIADDPAALAEWRNIMMPQQDYDTQVANLMIGEWHATTGALILPTLLTGELELSDDQFNIRNPQAFLDAYTHELTRAFGQESLPDSDSSTIQAPDDLESDAKELAGQLFVNVKVWLKGMDRATTQAAMTDALIAIALGEEPPVDPISGEPFYWDEASRTLHPPEGSMDIEPSLLP